MSGHNVRPLHLAPAAPSALSASQVGRIVDVQDGKPFVSFAHLERIPARVALSGLPQTPAAMLDGQPVLLLLENGDPALPVIVGLVTDTLPGLGADASFEVDGNRLSFEGREEVELRCGQASITLRADGQVIVKGTRLMSRASETNKIRGATVLIN